MADTTSKPTENPLTPNRTLQRIYQGMVESRLLEDHRRSLHRKLPITHGQEACRASALVDLTPQDLATDLPGVASTPFLRGTALPDLLAKHPETEDIEAPTTRLHLALGAARAFRHLQLPHVAVAFALASDLKPAAWRDLFRLAAHHELPILFVSLPDPDSDVKPFTLAARATRHGVPGIPVDAADALALYRVAQESLGRARAHGGPALMECIPFPLDTKPKHRPDPIPLFAQTLLTRRIATTQWLNRIPTAFQTRLAAL